MIDSNIASISLLPSLPFQSIFETGLLSFKTLTRPNISSLIILKVSELTDSPLC